ncbi:MAG: hypothetical protein IJB73_01300 [Firmicutes bacterium]|nr:hypothetical protein [Bacillota bacterium]
MKGIKKLVTIMLALALVLTAAVPHITDSAYAASKSSTIKGVEASTIKAKTTLTDEGKIKVSWTKSKGYKVDYYQIYRATSKNGTYKKIYTTKSGSAKAFTNSSVTEGKRYYYKVRGVRKINGKNYYTQWSNKVNRTAKINVTIKYNFEAIKFDSSEDAYKDSKGNVMVSIEAIADCFDAELKLKDGNKYAEISKTWTEWTAPYWEDVAGDVAPDNYPVCREMCFREGSLEGKMTSADMQYSEYTGKSEKVTAEDEEYKLTSKPVLKNGKLYVALEDVAKSLCLEVFSNEEKTEYTMVPYEAYNITWYYDREGTIRGDWTTLNNFVALQNNKGVLKAEIVRIDVTDIATKEKTKDIEFQEFDKLSTINSFLDWGLDISTALTMVKFPLEKEDSSYEVSAQVKLTKLNMVTETIWIKFVLE